MLAEPITAETGWSRASVVGGVSLGLLVAGLVSPRVGRAVQHRGGRPVLAASAGLLALGHLGLGLAPSLAAYYGAWLVLGVAMGAGLYDAAFSTLGRLYGAAARPSIGALTLVGGFASTVCWPLSAYLVSTLGWRGACFAYAGLHLAATLPLYLAGIPAAPRQPDPARGTERRVDPSSRHDLLLMALIAATVTVSAAVQALIAVHLIVILQDRGATLATAVALGALIGPSQVGARALEMVLGPRHHPIWTMVTAAILVAAGLILLRTSAALIAPALVLCGAGMGIHSIARGTVPLTLFGPDRYPVAMGRLALPSLLAQAAAPLAGAALLQRLGVGGTLTALMAAGLLAAMLAVVLLLAARTQTSARSR